MGTMNVEYVRELIRRDQDRRHLRELMLLGAGSPPAEPATPAYFEALRSRVHASSDIPTASPKDHKKTIFSPD
jgi:hypothetical protein